MTRHLPRGTCPVCGCDVAVRVNGAIREHHHRRSSGPPGFSEPAGTWVKCGLFATGAVKCPGSGKPSVETHSLVDESIVVESNARVGAWPADLFGDAGPLDLERGKHELDAEAEDRIHARAAERRK